MLGRGTLKAYALRDRLLDANINEVPTIVEDMRPDCSRAFCKAAMPSFVTLVPVRFSSFRPVRPCNVFQPRVAQAAAALGGIRVNGFINFRTGPKPGAAARPGRSP